jgi:hypothetical protein
MTGRSVFVVRTVKKLTQKHWALRNEKKTFFLRVGKHILIIRWLLILCTYVYLIAFAIILQKELPELVVLSCKECLLQSPFECRWVAHLSLGNESGSLREGVVTDRCLFTFLSSCSLSNDPWRLMICLSSLPLQRKVEEKNVLLFSSVGGFGDFRRKKFVEFRLKKFAEFRRKKHSSKKIRRMSRKYRFVWTFSMLDRNVCCFFRNEG